MFCAIASKRPVRSEARLFRPCAAKKDEALSSALLTLLPVARRSWVRPRRLAVLCSEARLARIEAVRVIEPAMGVAPFSKVKNKPGGALLAGPNIATKNKGVMKSRA